MKCFDIDGLCDKQVKVMQLLHAATQSLLLIANNVLDMAAISAGSLIIASAEFDLKEYGSFCPNISYERLLVQISSAAEVAAAAKQCRMRFTVDKSLPSRVVGDEVKLRQILHNMLDHALKRCGTGTAELTVRVLKAVPISGSGRFEYDIAFIASDDGPVMSDDQLEHVFSKHDGRHERYRTADLGMLSHIIQYTFVLLIPR